MMKYLHCRNIFPWEAVSGIGDQHTSLAHSPIAHYNTLDWPTLSHRTPLLKHWNILQTNENNTFAQTLNYIGIGEVSI